MMLFYPIRKIAGGIRGCNIFISWIILRWAAIRSEGEMFHDLYELNLGFGHFRRDWLKLLQGHAAGHWVIIRGVHDLGVGNEMWSVVGGWREIPGVLTVSCSIHCIKWVIIFVVGMFPVSGALLYGYCSCGGYICSHGWVWDGAEFIKRGRKFLLEFFTKF